MNSRRQGIDDTTETNSSMSAVTSARRWSALLTADSTSASVRRAVESNRVRNSCATARALARAFLSLEEKVGETGDVGDTGELSEIDIAILRENWCCVGLG